MNHLPIMRAKREIESAGKRCFEADLAAHLKRGYVYSGAECFIMARIVSSKLAGHWNDLEYAAGPETGDTWMVWLAAAKARNGETERRGDGEALAWFLKLMPVRLRYLAWHRVGDRLRVWELERFERKVLGKIMMRQNHEEGEMSYGRV